MSINIQIPKRVLSIGGSDSGGSAGIQADIKTYEARGVFGSTAITAVTAQDTQKVHSVHFLPEDFIAKQIEVVLSDIGTNAVKTGFLARESIVNVVAKALKNYQPKALVVDPVLVDGKGKQFASTETVAAYQTQLFPITTVITPNVDEAAILSGVALSKKADLYEAAKKLLDFGVQGVVIKGGHLSEGDTIVNLFYDGTEFIELTAPRLPIHNPHGVGCTFASAIAAELAKGHRLAPAVTTAHHYLQTALAGSQNWQLGQGRLPVNHSVGRAPLFEDN